MTKIKVLILSIFTFLLMIACGGGSSIIQNTSSTQNEEITNPEDNNPTTGEDINSGSIGDESGNTEGNTPTPPISEDPSEEAGSDAEELPQEPQVEVKYTPVVEKSNEVATVSCEEVYELGADNKKYSLFADFYGDYISGSSVLCSLILNEGYEKNKLKNVKWTFLGDKVFNNPKYSESIFIHITDKKKINPPVERCIENISYYYRLTGSKVTFDYDGVANEIVLANKTLSKLEARKFEHLPTPPIPTVPEEETIPTLVDDPLDCSKPRGLYDEGMLDIGKAPSTTLNNGANLPLIGYNYRGTNPFESGKTYIFIRMQGNSTKADYICKQQFNKEYACPRDFRFQICSGTASECYFTFRSDYMMKDTKYNVFHSKTSPCRVQIPLTNTINYAENTGFQYDGGKKMNFPFYVGDPSLVLNSSNSIEFVSVSVDNLDAKFSLLGGLPNFARGSKVKFETKDANKGDNNIALFTIIWKTYNGSYQFETKFDGWAKLPQSVIF